MGMDAERVGFVRVISVFLGRFRHGVFSWTGLLELSGFRHNIFSFSCVLFLMRMRRFTLRITFNLFNCETVAYTVDTHGLFCKEAT